MVDVIGGHGVAIWGNGETDWFMNSAIASDGVMMSMPEFDSWFAERARANTFHVARIPFADLRDWTFEPGTGNLVHASRRFFSIEGLRVRTDRAWLAEWTQPIIVQPEVGSLGILVKRFDGVLHCLMQAKMEPGNINGVQLSPTVQATRSNYTRVHGGAGTKYMDYFLRARRGRVHFDGLQSEQGAWFLHKRNRSIIVETVEDVPLAEDFCWLTLGQIRHLLQREHVVNMDSRAVLSCIPPAFARSEPGESFPDAVQHSFSGHGKSKHESRELLSWLTEVRTRRELVQQRIPLDRIKEGGWRRSPDAIDHQDGKHFEVIAVDVRAGNREVGSWTQPLVAPKGPGLLALLVKRINDVLHVLVQARSDAGALNVAELAPTVHCQPGNYHDVPERHRPPYLDYVLAVAPARIRFDVVHSEEGGRFYHARTRYMVIEVQDDFPGQSSDDYLWVTLNQLTNLLPHSNYVNVELRSLIACIQTI